MVNPTTSFPPPPPPPPGTYHSSTAPPPTQTEEEEEDDKDKVELVTFSSTCTPYRPKLEGSCQLPFGFILTPLSSSSSLKKKEEDEKEEEEEEEVPMCTTCLSYLNMYNSYEDLSGKWICELCRNVNYTFAGLLSSSSSNNNKKGGRSLMNPTVSFTQYTSSSSSSSSFNNNNKIDPNAFPSKNKLIVVLDGNLPTNEVSSIITSLRSILSSSEQEQQQMEFGLVIFDKVISIYQLSLRGIASARVFSAAKQQPPPLHNNNDNNNDEDDDDYNYLFNYTKLKRNVKEQGYLGDDWDTLQDCVKAYFGTFADDNDDDDDDKKKRDTMMQKEKGEATTKDTTTKLSRKEMLRLKREERLRRKQEQSQSQSNNTATDNYTNNNALRPSVTKRIKNKKKKQKHPYRCTGEAIRYALSIATSSSTTTTTTTANNTSSSSGRIVVFTNGAPNIGIANVTTTTHSHKKREQRVGGGGDVINDVKLSNGCRYFSYLGEKGVKDNVGIDVFCSGSHVLGIQAYQSLVSPSDGYTLSFPSFAADPSSISYSNSNNSNNNNNTNSNHQFHSDLTYVLHKTFMSRTNNYTTSLTNQHPPLLQQQQQQQPQQQQVGGGGGVDGLGLSNKSDFNKLSGVVVDVRMSSFLSPTHVVGPGTVLYDDDYPVYNDNQAGDASSSSSSHLGPMPNEKTIFANAASMAANHNEPTYNKPSKSFVSSTRTRFMLHRYDPKSTFTFMVQMNDDDDHDNKKLLTKSHLNNHRYALFQFIIRHVNKEGTAISTKIHTHRLPIAQSMQDFINGLQEDVVPVLLGREAVYRCIVGRYGSHDNTSAIGVTNDKEEEGININEEKGSLYCSKEVDEMLTNDARDDLDVTVFNISNAYRMLGLQTELLNTILNTTPEESDENKPSANTAENQQQNISALDFAFPPELSDALRLLHHLRRGPMLGAGPLQSFDDRAIQRNLFLRLPLDDCITMMAPSLWSLMIANGYQKKGEIGQFEFVPTPPETLALWDDSIIVADDFRNLFVWSGRSTATAGNPQHDIMMRYCEDFLSKKSKSRFPMPQLHVLREGESMSRRLTARLAPSHGDPPEQQLLHFPALGTLSQEELVALRFKFRFYDPSSDPSFRNWFWTVANAKSKSSRNRVVSLCD